MYARNCCGLPGIAPNHPFVSKISSPARKAFHVGFDWEGLREMSNTSGLHWFIDWHGKSFQPRAFLSNSCRTKSKRYLRSTIFLRMPLKWFVWMRRPHRGCKPVFFAYIILPTVLRVTSFALHRTRQRGTRSEAFQTCAALQTHCVQALRPTSPADLVELTDYHLSQCSKWTQKMAWVP